MDLPTLRQLRTFVTIVETGGLTQAARALHLTQPAVSQQLRELERILGVRVLDRTATGLVPTAAGAAILTAARRTQAAAAEVAAIALACRSGEVGRVRLGTGATACIYLLPSALARVKRRMPRLEVTVVTGDTADILDRVEAGAIDIAVVTLPMRLSRAIVKTHFTMDPLLALLPANLAPQSATISPAQLAKLPLILYEAGGNTRAIVDNWFARAGVEPNPIMELGNVEAIKVLVASGLGASILPKVSLEETSRSAVVRPLRPALTRELVYVLRKEKVLDRGLRTFLDELKKSAGK